MAGKSINELPEITSVSDSSLMALSSDGKTLGRVDARTFKNSVVGQHISNYIRYINQDIKLELSNGTLTLKAGSQVIAPNGFEADGTTPKFDYVTLQQDLSVKEIYPYTGNILVMVNANATALFTERIGIVSSGTTPGYHDTYGSWYDTTENIIKRTIDNGVTWNGNFALPIALCSYNNLITSIDQVFNGFGYIGSTIFALPGTVVSMPNGKEENGVLKNTEVEITSVRTVTLGSADTTDYIGYLSPTGIDYMLATNYYESAIPPTNKNGYAMWLNTQDNHFYVKNFSVSGSEWELVDALGNVCKFTTSSGKITKFESKSVLSLLDTNTFNLVPHIVETWSNGTSWYRLYSDGWCEQGGRLYYPSSSQECVITLHKPYINTNYTLTTTTGDFNGSYQYTSSFNWQWITVRSVTSTSFAVWSGQYACSSWSWKAEGYIA